MARRPGRGLELHRAALVRRASKALAASPGPPRARLRARASLAYLGGVLALRRLLALPDAAGGPCERSSRLLPALALAGVLRPAPRSPVPVSDPTGSRTVELVHGFWSLVSDVAASPGTRRSPDAPSRAPGHSRPAPTASRRSPSTISASPPPIESQLRAALRRHDGARPGHRARRHRPAGRFQHRLQRERARPPARGAGHGRRLRQAARQPRHGRGRRRAAPRRRGLGRHPDASAARCATRAARSAARCGRSGRPPSSRPRCRHGRAAPTRARDRVPADGRRRGRLPHARRARIRAGDVRPAEPRSGVRHRVALVRARVRHRPPGPAAPASHLRHAGRRPDPQRGRHRAAAVRGRGVRCCSSSSARSAGTSPWRTRWARPTPGAAWRSAP